MRTLLDDYIQGLSPSAQDVLRYLDLQLSLDKLLQAGKLLAVLEQFIGVDLSPEYISTLMRTTALKAAVKRELPPPSL